MSLATLPTFLLLPPANLLLPACAGAAFARRRSGRIVLGASLAALVLLAIPAVPASLARLLERGLPLAADPADPPAAIVVLSGDEQTDLAADGTRSLDISGLTLGRERAGAALARRTGLPLLVTGGAARPGWPALAMMMARSLHEDFGLDPRWLETRSADTWQNAAFSAPLLAADGIRSIYLVTDGWHMRRALIAFRAAGLRAIAAPVRLEPPLRATLAAFLPTARAWHDSYYALHEWIGCAVYAWRAR